MALEMTRPVAKLISGFYWRRIKVAGAESGLSLTLLQVLLTNGLLIAWRMLKTGYW